MSEIRVTNPSTGEILADVPSLDVQAAAEALERARRAQKRWAERSIRDRADVVLRFNTVLLDRAEEVSELLARENGKPLQEAFQTEVLPIADLASWYARRAEEILHKKSISLHLLKHRQSYLHYKPHGVVLVIGPYNYPFTIPMGTVIPALLAGNAVLFKPASLTPLIALKARELFDEAGLDPDVFQVLPCAGRVASEIIDMGVDNVNFTGSTATGRDVASRAARALVPFSMELGGKDPAIVLEDADIDWTVGSLVWGAFCNAGQTCASVERAYVHESIFDKVVEGVVARTQALRVGDPMAGEMDMGPMTDPGQLRIVREHVADAVASGARVAAGGKLIDGPGQFFEPTVLVDVNESMTALVEETFGPTLPILKVRDEDEAIRRANDSVYGLDAYVFTRDRARARRVAERLEAGTVMINEVLITHAAPETPWGGVKTSGVGRVHGEDGLRDMCEAYHVNEDRFPNPLKASPFWQPYSQDMYERLVGASRMIYRPGARTKAAGLMAMLRGTRNR